LIVEAVIAAPTIYLEIEIDDEVIQAELEDPDNAAMGLEDLIEKLAREGIADAKEEIMNVTWVSEAYFHDTVINTHLGDLVEEYEEAHPEAKRRHL
jgi:hypothetical protein